jgi:hypothetical protein
MTHDITAHVTFQVDATSSLSATRGRSWSSSFFKPQVLRPLYSIPYFMCVKPLSSIYHLTFMLPLIHILAYYEVINAAVLFVRFHLLSCIWRFTSTSLKATFIKVKVSLHTPWKLTVQWRYTSTHTEPRHVMRASDGLHAPASLHQKTEPSVTTG